ncbi:MAG: GDP-mannose mannosyl hydrolase [Haloarculaceae archaeon]
MDHEDALDGESDPDASISDGGPGHDGFVADQQWTVVVRNVPIVSVDLVVRSGDGVVLGKRTNEPAKGEWFVPGGRVRKNERLDDAVHRVARDELGVEVTVDRKLGVYEHFWDVADVDGVDGKHYVPVGYVVTPESETFRVDDQHDELRRFEPPFETVDLHPYVQTYLEDADVLASL